MPKPPKLPVGIQTFEQLREEGYLYVDKTGYLIDMIDNGKFYFLSRPRRFGKSLTISTFDALFSGKRELFMGLAAEEFFERPDFRPRPVIRLDMSEVSAIEGREALFSRMMMLLERNADIHGVAFRGVSPQEALARLIWDVSAAKGPAVVLIDEYDSPLLDVFDDHDKSASIREIMRDFYKQIKAADERLCFVFITGISKFSRMGVFSAMNNILDVSVDKKYGAMLGYTEEELISNFSAHIDATAREMNTERGELMSRVEDYYDGFSFDGITRLYNPYSTLYFFQRRDFLNYWFESGTPSFIAKYMKDLNLTVEQFRGTGVSKDFAVSPGEIENASAASFLYQSGYLTLRPGTADDYSLDYPNREVLVSMSRLLTENIFSGHDEPSSYRNIILRCLAGRDAEGVVEQFNRILSAIPYDDFAGAARASVREHGYKFSPAEWLYRSTLLAYLRGVGVNVEAELHSGRGRADMVVAHKGRVWVMELKIARDGADASRLADGALAQIAEMGYAERYVGAVMLGMVIDDAKRSITEYRVRTGG
ncbi:MAG: ATP-binding protein [Synergistaceae bacterium]|jgi:hypothetical protein|nr:ATP-binding protein [Synergistaceae bacterium]